MKEIYNREGTKKEDLLKLDEIELDSLSSKVYLSSKIESQKSFCYNYRNGEEIIKTEYSTGQFDLSASFVPSGDFLQLAVWDPQTNELVVKRLKIKKGSLPSGFEQGKIVANEDFKKEIKNMAVGEVLYFNVGYSWIVGSGSLSLNIYSVKKVNKDEIRIFAYNGYDPSIKLKNEEGWHKLDCEQSYFKFLATDMNIDEIQESSLKENFARHCTWG